VYITKKCRNGRGSTATRAGFNCFPDRPNRRVGKKNRQISGVPALVFQSFDKTRTTFQTVTPSINLEQKLANFEKRGLKSNRTKTYVKKNVFQIQGFERSNFT